MVRAFTLAIGQLSDPRFIRLLLGSTLLTLLVFAGVWWGLDRLVSMVDSRGWPLWAANAWDWIDGALAPLGLLLSLWLLFPAVATAIMGILLDVAVDAVEDRHYPHARAPRPMGWVEGPWLGLLSGLRLLAWNLLALPVYLLLLFTAVGPLVLFVLLNGYLLGRDYVQMVAIRHLGGRGERAFRAANRPLLFRLGLPVTLLFMVPGLNLLAPLIGAALATHLFHEARGDRPAGAAPRR